MDANRKKNVKSLCSRSFEGFFFVFEKVAIEIGRVNRTIEKGNDWGKM